MIKWGKRFPILVALASVLLLSAIALSGVGDQRELAKAERAKQLIAQKQIVSDSQPLDPAVLAKQQMEAEIEAKLAAEMAAEAMDQDKESGPMHPVKPIISRDKDRQPGANTIAGHAITYEPRTIFLQEDFEGETFPPVGWDTINTDPDYGWFLGSYSGGGTQCALVTWHAAGYIQDEWLITPQVDVSTATSLLRLEFEMLKGYSYPHDFKVYVSFDGTSFTEIWDSYDVAYPEFTWYPVSIDLSAYAGGSPIWVGFQYYGEDADLFGIDNVVITDDAPPTGRCCYGDPATPTCEDVTLAECDALGGSWAEGLNCTDNPCPVAGPNDNCAEVTPETLPFTFVGNNEAATFDTECQYFGDYPNVWTAFTITECSDITISYCGTQAGWGNGWLNLITDCSCADGTLISGATYDFNCGNGNPNIYFDRLPAGTYYYPIMLDPANGAAGDYSIEITAVACPPATPGDNCEDPLVVELNAAALPYTIANQYTCDRFDYYDATCLGSYDGGEDLIIQVDVSEAMFVNITLDPKGTTWSGMSIASACPDNAGACIGTISNSSGSPKTIPDVALDPGTYYIMVDTWPSPDCIPDLDIIFEASTGPEEGDNCANPIKVDIPTLPWEDLNQTTCGRTDSWDAGCLGLYDNGEDIFYEITVLSPVTVNIELDPKGTTYTGMAIATDCPPTNCLGLVSGSSSSPKYIKCLSLDPGTYYLMVDTWPSPDCIPDFDLRIYDTTCAALENDDCAGAEEVNEVTDLAFSTLTATFDGPGGCQTAPNIWYLYTVTEAGDAVISLCGSDYDTKMAVYGGECEALTEIACNDDACGLQSEIELVNVNVGDKFYIEVGGYGTNTGDGILNIDVVPTCEVSCSGTPEGEPCIADDGVDATNGGCNSDPPVFGSIGCNETVCGQWNTYLFGGSNYRDTDWYTFTLDDYYDVTITAIGEFPIVTGFLEQVVDGGGVDCGNFTGSIAPYGTGDKCDTVVVQRLAMGPGDYAIFVGGTEFTGYPCSAGPFDYKITVDCVPAVPTYCAASGGCDEYIENVTFESINNTTGCDGYGDHTDLVAAVEPGGSYPITITIGGAYSSDTGAVYVDWNQDLDFDDPGETASLNPGGGYGPYQGTVTVPADAAPGNTRMRIRLAWNTNPSACGSLSYGEVEDYTIQVGEPAPPFMIYPEVIPVIAKYTIDPMNGSIYMSNDMMETGSILDMEAMHLDMGGCIIPVTSVDSLDGWGPMTGDIMKITFPLAEFVVCEETNLGGLVWDQVESFFDVYYEIEGVPGAHPMSVPIRGHISGDVNLDGAVNITDLTAMVNFLFKGGDAPPQPAAANVDGSDSDQMNVLDLTYMVDYLFQGGPAPTH